MFDAALITTAAAGVRRATGISARDYLLPKISNTTARNFMSGYFKVGELIVSSGMNYAAILKANRESGKDKDAEYYDKYDEEKDRKRRKDRD